MSSTAFQRSSANSIHRSSFFVRDMPSFYGGFQADRRFPAGVGDDDDDSSSSSIERNSDLVDSGEDFGVSEVRSKGPLDTMAALKEVLPVKRGISKFYNGKSKSFTSLADAYSASSAQDLAKPENPYSKKRKNQLLAPRGGSNIWHDKNHEASPSKNNDPISASKKPSIYNQTPLNQGYPINYSKSSINIMEEESKSRSSSPSSSRPPLHPIPSAKPSYNSSGSCSSPPPPPPLRNSPWRSLSLCDLQSAAGNYND